MIDEGISCPGIPSRFRMSEEKVSSISSPPSFVPMADL